MATTTAGRWTSAADRGAVCAGCHREIKSGERVYITPRGNVFCEDYDCGRNQARSDNEARSLALTESADAPQSCYPEEIETLREMLEEARVARGVFVRRLDEGRNVASMTWAVEKQRRRIESICTAIEALGGAL